MRKTIEKSRKRGNRKAAGGAILFVIVQKKIFSEAASFQRDKAYVAIIARTVTKIALQDATIIEFHKYSA